MTGTHLGHACGTRLEPRVKNDTAADGVFLGVAIGFSRQKAAMV